MRRFIIDLYHEPTGFSGACQLIIIGSSLWAKNLEGLNKEKYFFKIDNPEDYIFSKINPLYVEKGVAI